MEILRANVRKLLKRFWKNFAGNFSCIFKIIWGNMYTKNLNKFICFPKFWKNFKEMLEKFSNGRFRGHFSYILKIVEAERRPDEILEAILDPAGAGEDPMEESSGLLYPAMGEVGSSTLTRHSFIPK